MNGQDIPSDHGYPLRLIVPGSVAAKQVKWLSHIEIEDSPTDSSWQSGVAYKMLPSNIIDFSEVTPQLLSDIATVDILPIQSLICDIQENTQDPNTLSLKGIAISGNGRNILRVEISTDKGNTWTVVDLKQGSEQVLGKAWAWTFWELILPKKAINKGDTIMVKATDIDYHSQPENIKTIWNLRGILNNSWHQVVY